METLFIVGAISAGLAVAMGAFGAHALKSRLTPQRLETFKTAVRYQMYHALALLLAAFATNLWPSSNYAIIAGWLFILGTVLFSGSLFALTFSDRRGWGAVAPLGGLSFLTGWVFLAVSAL